MPRKYDNEHRREQAELTRERILEVMVKQLAHGNEEISLADVAEEAGVSLRSLHNHFPNQEARAEALADYINRRTYQDQEPGPRSAADLPHFAARAMGHLFANEELLRAQLAGGFAREVRGRRKSSIKRRIRKASREVTSKPSDRKRLEAVLMTLVRAETGFFLKDELGLSEEEVATTLQWATEALVCASR